MPAHAQPKQCTAPSAVSTTECRLEQVTETTGDARLRRDARSEPPSTWRGVSWYGEPLESVSISSDTG